MWPGRPEMCVLDEDQDATHLGLFIAEEPEEPVGIVSIFFGNNEERGAWTQMRKLAVRQDLQGRGFGKALVKESMNVALAKNHVNFFCHARSEQAGFY